MFYENIQSREKCPFEKTQNMIIKIYILSVKLKKKTMGNRKNLILTTSKGF